MISLSLVTEEKMNELVLRYEVLSGYVCKVPTANEYVSTSSPLEISVCKESF